MEDKIKSTFKTKLKVKYGNLGLSEKTFDRVVEFYGETITEESQIEAKVLEAKPLLVMAQGEADRVRNDSQSQKTELEQQIEELKGKLEKKSTDPAKSFKKDGEGGTDPELEELKATVRGLKEKLDNGDKASAKQAKLDKARDLMIEKGVDKKLCDGMLTLATVNSTDDDTVEAIAERGVTEYNNFVSTVAPKGSTPRSPEHSVTDEGRTDFFANKKAENEAKNKQIANLNQ